MNKIFISNPLIWADAPDVDVVCYKNAFYMVSTSMHSMPGCPIMKSTDLVHWTLCHYVFDTFEQTSGHTLEDGVGVYGKGSWAASLKVVEDTFYVAFNCNDTQHFYVYRCDDIEKGNWKQIARIEGFFHDPALHFEEDKTPYVIYGCGDIRIVELENDLSDVKKDGVHQLLLSTPRENIGLRCEGGHAYKIGEYYYLIFIEWPTDGHGRRREVCYRSKNLFGPYERKVIMDDDMEYANQGVAQGCIFEDGFGNWFSMLFQDHFALGRIPCLMPLRWEENWPVLGIEGKVPKTFESNIGWDVSENEGKSIHDLVMDDDFDYTEDKLPLQWQWNHNPDHNLWSVTERNGYLRLHTGKKVTKGVCQARNTLTQRTVGPECKVQVQLDYSNLMVGDSAGLVALQGQFGCIGVKRLGEEKWQLQLSFNDGNYGEEVVWSKLLDGDIKEIKLQIRYDFHLGQDKAYFSYSVDGNNFEEIPAVLQMRFTLDHFMGYRTGMYCYATENDNGFADFDYFKFV